LGKNLLVRQLKESVMHKWLLSALAVGFMLGLVSRLQAEDTRDLATVAEDVPYGHKSGVALTMDVFTPKKDANGAAIIVMMSGGWVSGRDAMMPLYRPFITEFVKRGYTTFAVYHGAQPQFTVPDAVADVNRAVRFIRSHAKEYAIDPDRIGVSGASAGGHLSLMQGTAGDKGDPKAKDAVDKTSSRVQAVACFYPPTDFLNYGAKGKNAFAADGVLVFLRAAVDVREMDPKTHMRERLAEEKQLEMLKKISPLTHANADTPPTLIVHGDADKLVPIEQAEVFVAKLKDAGVTAQLVVKKGAGHGWADQAKDVVTLADWFDKYLNKK
jgi:acetyl esterase/lipase